MLKKKSPQVQKGQPHKFAVVCASGLGDALLSMVIAYNLAQTGFRVTTFSSILCELKDWFPSTPILPHPSHENFYSTFAAFDTVIAADHSMISEAHCFDNHLIVLNENAFDKTKTMVENLRLVCSHQLQLIGAEKSNGVKPPASLKWRLHSQRVILHPSSSDAKKNWPASKYIALARELEKEGYDPYFCVSPLEHIEWKNAVSVKRLPFFPQLDTLAAFIYESGYLIGNDSGLGHLASALNIPTLSLFARKGYSNLWRPGWGFGRVVSPPPILPGSYLKQKYWKDLLSVGRVRKAFMKVKMEEKR